MNAYFVVRGALLGFIELIGIGIAVAIYLSDRRARTDADHYIYSPTNKPSIKTPKRAFFPLPIMVATFLVIIGVLDYWRAELNAIATVAFRAILYLDCIGIAAVAIWLLLASRPVEDPPAEPPNDTLGD